MANAVGGAIEDVTGFNVSNSSAADRALEAQQGAAHASNEMQRYMYDTTRKDNEPWRQAGVRALGGLESNDFQRDFTAQDFQADPGYAFRLAEGQKAIARASAAKGLFSTGTLKSLTNYNQGMASDEYQKAYDRFNNDRTIRFNRLASIAGLGQTATAQNQVANTNYANAYGDNVTGAANAQAANSLAQQAQRNQFISQITSYAGRKAGGGTPDGGIQSSDIRVKTNIEPISKEDLKELKASIKPYKWNYKNESHGEGDWIGVMAQDLEKSKLGRTLLTEDREGVKQIDINKAVCLILATMAEG